MEFEPKKQALDDLEKAAQNVAADAEARERSEGFFELWAEIFVDNFFKENEKERAPNAAEMIENRSPFNDSKNGKSRFKSR